MADLSQGGPTEITTWIRYVNLHPDTQQKIPRPSVCTFEGGEGKSLPVLVYVFLSCSH